MTAPLTVGFVTNRLSLRGTETVLWTYAHYNEVMLGNRSLIFVNSKRDIIIEPHNREDNCEEAKEWFINRFEQVHFCSTNEIEQKMKDAGVDVCFIELAGVDSDWVPTGVPSVLHCVFQPLHKGTVSTAISTCVGKGKIPVLPNIMPSHHTTDDMREELDIPKDAVVFGRYGGYNQFSINYAKDAVRHVAAVHPDIYFVFMNTAQFMEPAKNVIFLPGTRDMYKKQRFINTCDAYLHAREDGETFGAAIGEFALSNKNIVTTKDQNGQQNEHLDILGDKCIRYEDYNSLVNILENYISHKKDMMENGYYMYTPEKIIPKFGEFINEAVRLHHERHGS